MKALETFFLFCTLMFTCTYLIEKSWTNSLYWEIYGPACDTDPETNLKSVVPTDPTQAKGPEKANLPNVHYI